MQTRAQHASAAVALAGRAKVHDAAVIVLQKYVRRWLAYRRLRSLRFQVLFSMGRKSQQSEKGVAAGDETADTGTSETCRNSTARFRVRPSHNSCTQDNFLSRKPLVAIEMQRKEERRWQLRKAYAERKENQPQSPVVTRCLTPQQARKVSRRNYPHSRNQTPATSRGAPLRPFHNPDSPALSDHAVAQAVRQRSGASDPTEFSRSAQPMVQVKSKSAHTRISSPPDRIWTPGTVCKDDHGWLSVLSLEDEYNRKQQVLSHSRSDSKDQRKPLRLKIEEGGENPRFNREHVPKDPADIAYVMTQTQQGSVLENVDSCFRLLTGRYRQCWALPSTHKIDERDWAHRQMLNKVQSKEGELYRPLNGRIIQTGEDVAAVIDELNRALTPSLEEFRARTAPVCTESHSHHALNDDSPCDFRTLGSDRDAGTPGCTSICSMDHLQGYSTTTEFQANQNQTDEQMENIGDLVRVSSRNSWDSEQQRDQDIVPQAHETDDAEICLKDRGPNESLLCSHAVLDGDGHDSLQPLGPLASATSGAAADFTTHENDEEIISSFSMPSDFSAGWLLCTEQASMPHMRESVPFYIGCEYVQLQSLYLPQR